MTSPARHAYLDRVRGLAVLIMIEGHVLDSWTRLSDRSHPVFDYAMMLGGFGAPLFLFLAGVAVVLSAEAKLRRRGDFSGAWRAVRNRGWQVFGLAFLFRLQSYILSGGADALNLLKVDILNVMGPSIAMTAIAGRAVRSAAARAMVFAVATVVISLLTPLVRVSAFLNWLPDPVEWYFRPFPGRTHFTLFPWAGFVFAGALAGMVVNPATDSTSALRRQTGLLSAAVLAACLAYAGSFLPSIYSRSDFWTSSPSYFFLRVGIVTALLPLAFLWERAPWRGKVNDWSPLQTFGQSSLFVYWVHVEMVYGLLSRPLRRSLGLGEVVIAYLLFTLFLLALVLLKNRFWEGRKMPAVPHQGPTPASI
jgi:uncharacterized membrane protein